MSIKLECRSKWNGIKDGMSLIIERQSRMSVKIECHFNGMSLKMKCPSTWNITQNVMSLKMESHSKWNVTKKEISLKIKCHSK